ISANDVWAVGQYSNSSSSSQTLTMHWNGTAWSVVSSPSPGIYDNELRDVTAVASNDVWAVGDNGYGIYQTLIEHWNGSAWAVVPSPNVGTTSNYLYGVAAVSANDVWAVGYYGNFASLHQTLIEHWNGSTWSISSSPNVGTRDN